MPSFRDVLCEVIDDDTGAPLQEWGIQQPRGSNTIGSYVQADTGRRFAIRLYRPIPFPPGVAAAKQLDRELYTNPVEREHYSPPYDLLCQLRFDGRSNVETECLLLLDEKHEDFIQNVFMLGGTAVDEKREAWHYKWVFDTAGGIHSQPHEDARDDLADFMENLGLRFRETAPKAGLLKITLLRVEIVSKPYEDAWKRKNLTRDSNIGAKADRNVSHKAVADSHREKGARKTEVTDYEILDHEPYAVFMFWYRSEDVLRKHEFEGFPEEMPKEFEGLEKMTLGDPGIKRRCDAQGILEEEDESPRKSKRATTDGEDKDSEMEDPEPDEEEEL